MIALLLRDLKLRITSYNVCYTKLLREIERVARRGVRREPAQRAGLQAVLRLEQRVEAPQRRRYRRRAWDRSVSALPFLRFRTI